MSEAKSSLITSSAPDGGWGWVIMFASFFIHVIVIGTANTFGIFFNGLIDAFGTSYSSTSLVSSVQMGVSFCIGPITSHLVNKYGCRRIIVAGSLVAAIGLITSGMAQNIDTLYISAGLCTGVGLGLIHLPATVAVSMYFDKKRAFASGIASCGSGIGTLIMAPIVSLLEKNFGWGYTMMMIGALMLACLPLGLLFKPIANDKSESMSIQKNDVAMGTNPGSDYLDNAHETSSCTTCLSLFVTTVKTKCPGKLYDAVFSICLLSNFLMNVGFAVPYVYTVSRAMHMSIEQHHASFLISVIGISNIIGKIVLGWISDHKRINRLQLYMICICLCGISLMLSNFCSDYATQIIYCAFFGATSGAYVGLTPVILIDLIGLDHFLQAYGIQLVFIGIARIIGPPIIGALHDTTGNLNAGFYFAGATIFLSGLILVLIPWMDHIKKKRKYEMEVKPNSTKVVMVRYV